MEWWQMALYILFLLIGMVLLVKGADWFVDGASNIAKALIGQAEEKKQAMLVSMRDTLAAVLTAYDAELILPQTIRDQWVSAYLDAMDTSKGSSDKYEGFLFAVYLSQTADGTMLCFSLEHS